MNTTQVSATELRQNLMAEAEFSGWQETIHLLSRPRNAERLRPGIAAAADASPRDLIAPDPLGICPKPRQGQCPWTADS
jgi:hypothetical protein